MRRASWIFLFGFLAIGSTIAARSTSEAPTPDYVEEDWQLVVNTPDFTAVGPQITSCMSAASDGSEPFVAFDMNYKEFPNFTAGGMQLQVWSNGNVLATSGQGNAQFNTPGETITWTQGMGITGGAVYYKINNGQSTTWGNFGQGNHLTVAFAPNAVQDMSSYTPDYSVKSSGATWEGNLVDSLTITQVRYYAGGQLLSVDNTQRSIALPPP